MPERNASIGKDFAINPEGVDPMQINKDILGHQVHEASKKSNAGGGKKAEANELVKQRNQKLQEAEIARIKHYKDVFKALAEKDPVLKEISESTPIKSRLVEAFVVGNLESGKSLQDTARELKTKVIEGKDLDNSSKIEATKWLTTVAKKISSPELIITTGEASSKFVLLQINEIPEIAEPINPGNQANAALKEAYQQAKIAKQQQDALVKDSGMWQRELSVLPETNLTGRHKKLANISEQLIEGTTQDGAKALKYQKEQAETVIQRIREQMEQLEVERQGAMDQRDIRQGIEREASYIREGVESGRFVPRSPELAAIFNNPDLATGRPIEVNTRNLQGWEIELLLQGVEGAEKWKATFRREKMGAPNEPFSMRDISDQQKWESVKDLLRELHGSIEGPKIIEKFQIDFDMFSQVDGVQKNAETGVKGTKVEDQVKPLKFSRNEEAARLTKYPLFDLAKAHFTESLKFTITDNVGAKYSNSLKYLQGVDNGTSRVHIWRNLKKQRDIGAHLTDAETNQLQLLDKHIERVSEGIMLRDEYMLPASSDAYQSLRECQKKYIENEQILQQGNLNAADRQALESQQRDLSKTVKESFLEYTKNENYELDIHDVDTVLAINTLSPIQIEARQRMIKSLLETNSVEYVKSIEWKIYEALWAAKAYSVTQGEAMEIGAKLARAPARDLRWTLGFKSDEIPAQATMNRGYAEAYQRILNPALFADDFSFGGKLGDDVRNLHYSIVFRMAGYDFQKDKNVSQAWKDRARARVKEGVPEWVVMSEYAEQALGFSFSETIRPEILVTGLQQLSSTWRMEKSGISPLREEYLRAENLPPGADPYLEGLGFRFNGANKEYKMTILRKMLQRKSSTFFDLVGADLDLSGTPHGGIEFGSSEWQLFRRSLATAEIHMWKDEAFKYNGEFDFMSTARRSTDFNPLMESAINVNGGVATPELLDKFFSIMTKMKAHMEDPTANGKTRLENWGQHKFQNNFVLTNTDFDWSKVDAKQLNYFSFERRINDLSNQGRARDLANEVKFKTEYLSPLKGKETDTINKIKEHRDAINSYSAMEPAELSASSLMELVVEWNRLRAIDSKAFPIAFIPGGISLLRRAGGLEMLTDAIGNLKDGDGGKLKDKKWFGKVEGWPKSLAQAVSYDVKWSGNEGNAWDEYRIAGFFASAETAKLFVNKPDLLRDLKRKFHTGFAYRWFYGVPRKYWWVIPVATVGIAAGQSLEEEKKK